MVKPHRIAENFDVFNLVFTTAELAAINALETGLRSGLEPSAITMADFGKLIPEA